ncbi:hypothetical protein DF222_11140, partial [Corynebacterium yudongzhengii]
SPCDGAEALRPSPTGHHSTCENATREPGSHATLPSIVRHALGRWASGRGAEGVACPDGKLPKPPRWL